MLSFKVIGAYIMEGPIKSAAGNRRPGDELADLELGQSEVSNRCEGGAQAVEGKPVLIINGKTEDEIIAQIAKIAGDDLPKLGEILVAYENSYGFDNLKENMSRCFEVR